MRRRPEEVNPYIGKIREYPNIITADADGNYPTFPLLPVDRPIYVEIGSGSGGFMEQMVARYPDIFYVGFELRYKRLYKTAEKVARIGREGYVVQCPAEEMEKFFPPASIQRIIVNFPDPWSKLRTRKHRMMSQSNLEQFAKLLRADGEISFKTDHREYFLWARDNVAAAGFEIVWETLDLHNSPHTTENILTEFEKMFLYKVPTPIGALFAKAPAR